MSSVGFFTHAFIKIQQLASAVEACAKISAH